MKRILIILIITLSSCSLFETRNPESPVTNKSSFQPPYSAQIVISNFIASISEKNVDNYISCLADSMQGDQKSFIFVPSQEALTRFPGQFTFWSLSQEKRYFNFFINSVPGDSTPQLILKNTEKFDVFQSDSCILTSDYEFYPKHSNQNVITNSRGTLQFAIYRRTSGLWAIQRWTDIKFGNDSTLSTWSILKAQFY